MNLFRLYLDSQPEWMMFGACTRDEIDPDLFFPWADEDTRVPKAKAICASCTVAADCLEFAMSTYQVGIWGGTTETERREIRADSARNP